MTQRMSAAQYQAMVAATPATRGRSSGRMMRLPADFQPAVRGVPAGLSAVGDVPENPVAKKISSAQKARERVAKVVDALEGARTEVEYSIQDDGSERVMVRVFGGETLPPNRAANIGREQSKLSQRAFSRYKHACADRMRDAATLLQAQVRAAGRQRFNSEFSLVKVSYGRQVDSRTKSIDEDAVAYSFKYVLDGLVTAGVLVDDSSKYVRMGEVVQRVGAHSVLLIELVQMKGQRD
jgi:hypothetical protein